MEMEQSDPEDRDHFKAVCAAFFNYHVDSLIDFARMERSFETLSSGQLTRLLIPCATRVQRLKTAVGVNYALLSKIVHQNRGLFPYREREDGSYVMPNLQVGYKDVTKLRSTIRQIVRDWGEQGQLERDESYKLVIEEVQAHFPTPKRSDGSLVSVLTPGAGLGRLSFEFARLGFKSQGNEFSYFMLLVSDFILNKTRRRKEFQLYPFVHESCNVLKFEDMLRVVEVPDICPAQELGEEDDFSMVAGEFIEVYSSHPSSWDCVVTCFFIDTANNILQYIETIHSTLKPGGLWVNFGPLLYHYSDQQAEVSVDLTWEEVRHAILEFGFRIEKEEERISHYDYDPLSLLQISYKCIFFTAIKST